MSATEATIWFIATALTVMLVIGVGILEAAHVLGRPHLPHRHRH